MDKLKQILEAGKVNFLMDGNAGSSGKGKMSEFIVANNEVDFLITSNSANASHTVVKGGKEYVFKALPSASIHYEKLDYIFIVDNASFEINALFDEIKMTGIPMEKVRISPRAGIITKIDKDYELGLCDINGIYFEEKHDGTVKTGTTASGSGSVLAKKTLRNKTLLTAKDVDGLKPMVSDFLPREILNLLKQGKTGFFEIGQGFPLSNNHPTFAPYTTSRNVTVSSALNDAFLPPSVCGNVILNFRTYPIKIHSNKYKATEDFFFKYPKGITKEELFRNHTLLNGVDTLDEKHDIVHIKEGDFLSWYEKAYVEYETIESYSGNFYPDQEEISWEELNRRMGNHGVTVFECTTLTKLPRRVAEFSVMNLEEAILYNDTGKKTFISINFANYIDNEISGSKDIKELESSEKFVEWLDRYIYPSILGNENVELLLVGTGADSEDIIVM